MGTRINKLKLWLRKQSYLISEIIKLQKQLKVEYTRATRKIKELDAGKAYWIYTEGDPAILNQMLDDVALVVPWKLPPIIVSSEPLNELTEAELKKLIKEAGKRGKAD